MSAKERERLKLLHEVSQRHITQKQAAAELGLSVRWVRKLLVRQRTRGDGGLRHGLRGRASNRKTPEAVKRRAVELYRKKKQAKLWHDYGPTLAAEELAEQHGIQVSQWLIEAKLWRRRRARVEQAHVWRARRARYGELLQWNISEHDWREGRGEKLYLIARDLTERFRAIEGEDECSMFSGNGHGVCQIRRRKTHYASPDVRASDGRPSRKTMLWNRLPRVHSWNCSTAR